MITHETREPEFCTVAEAAEMLRVSRPTVRRWIASGRLPAKKVGPRTVRLQRAAIDRLASDAEGPTSEPWWKRYAVQLGDPTVSEEAVMADIRAMNKKILARRGGKRFESSLSLIHEQRR